MHCASIGPSVIVSRHFRYLAPKKDLGRVIIKCWLNFNAFFNRRTTGVYDHFRPALYRSTATT